MKIYIASFFDTRERLRPHRDALWKMGHEVVSSWLDEVAKPAHMSKDEFWRKLAFKDLAEVRAADMLIIDTLDVSPRGGREVEFGFALGAFAGKTTVLVGPVRNVFHELADYKFEDWDTALELLDSLKPAPKDQLEPNTTPSADGWIAWSGGDMPVPRGAMVEVKFRLDGVPTERNLAGAWRWNHYAGVKNDYDIVAYRRV